MDRLVGVAVIQMRVSSQRDTLDDALRGSTPIAHEIVKSGLYPWRSCGGSVNAQGPVTPWNTRDLVERGPSKSPVCGVGSRRSIGVRRTSASCSRPFFPTVQSQGCSSTEAWEGGNLAVSPRTDAWELSFAFCFVFVQRVTRLIVYQALSMPVPECASTAHSSQASTVSECSDGDSNECKINVHTPVVVAWEGHHMQADLSIQHDRSTSTAFLKLRASLVLKALSPAKSYLYLLIPPERISTLKLDDSPDPAIIPVDTAKTLDSSFACLLVTLAASMDLVGPRSVAHTPKNRVEGRVLDQLRSLVRTNAFTIFIPHRAVPKSQLLSMTYGICDRLLISDPGQVDLACLYEGRGGVMIAVGEPDQPLTGASDLSKKPSGDTPPSYAEAGPALFSAVKSAEEPPASKKRRLNSNAATEHDGDLLAVMRRMVREEVRIQVSEEVLKLETRLKENVIKLLNETTDIQSLQWAEELEATRQEFDNKLEDDFFGVRMKLEDFIKEELTEAEERIIEHLQSTASVHLEFGS